MSIQTELTRITNAKAAIKAAIEGKGVTVPDGTMLDGMAALIESIEAGGGGLYFEKTTFSANTSSYTLNHNLGKKPNLCFYAILNQKNSIEVKSSTAGIFAILDGVMRYANIGTGNSSSSGKGIAYVGAGTVEGVSEIQPITGLSLFVPSVVTESTLTLKGFSYKLPSGDYLFCCGQFTLGGGS